MKKRVKKEEFDKKCLCGHAKSSHDFTNCDYCPSCEFYEPQIDKGQEAMKRKKHRHRYDIPTIENWGTMEVKAVKICRCGKSKP